MEFIETILIKNGKIDNFDFHVKRVKKTFEYFKWKFNEREWRSLMDNGKWRIENEKWKMENGELSNKKYKVKSEKLRMRITYNQFGIKNIEYFEVKKREFKTFRVVDINFDYHFKYKNRKCFENLKKDCDEAILIKNNLVTDTTISNLAFFTGDEWITPKHPLLKGTKREELIKKGFLKEENIKKSDLKYFKKIAMINAILGFFEIEDFNLTI